LTNLVPTACRRASYSLKTWTPQCADPNECNQGERASPRAQAEDVDHHYRHHHQYQGAPIPPPSPPAANAVGTRTSRACNRTCWPDDPDSPCSSCCSASASDPASCCCVENVGGDVAKDKTVSGCGLATKHSRDTVSAQRRSGHVGRRECPEERGDQGGHRERPFPPSSFSSHKCSVHKIVDCT